MKKTATTLFFLLAVLGVTYLGVNYRPKPGVQKQTRFLMDTYITIQAPRGDKEREAINKAMNRMAEIDAKFSAHATNSPVYRFNNGNEPIDDAEIVGLAQTAGEVCRLSDGAFDITIYPLVELWGFYGNKPALPADADIAGALGLVGPQNLEIRDGKLTKLRAGVKIDLGGIAKGYAVSQAAQVLRTAGLDSALIDAGGDIYALGKIHGRPWRVGIRDPSGTGVLGALELSDETAVTSGDYERFFEKDGVRYHHILDPRTGRPARGLHSVTVVAKDATLADGYSTAIFVLGPERGMKFAAAAGACEAVMVSDDGRTLVSPGLEGRLAPGSAGRRAK